MKGFTLVEMIIVIAITLIITAIVLLSFSSARSKKQLEVVTDSISSKLEEAKANALSGKNGSSFSIVFSTTTYNTITIPESLEIATNFSDGTKTITFSRITGIPQATGMIIISDKNNSSASSSITIGSMGDISVVK